MKPSVRSCPADEKNIGVGILVFDSSKTKILLGKRRNCFRAGMWGIPAGRVCTTELIKDAMHRELREETGTIAVNFKYLGVVREYQEELSGSFIHFIYLCTQYAGIITNVEPEKCEGWTWHNLKHLPQNILRGHRRALDLLTQHSPIVEYVA